ncbi:MAG TPA: hypothetical protein VGE85_10245 [Terracidiphilus sp.]|jgi:hypothetical protein
MLKKLLLIGIAIVLFIAAKPHSERFSKYKALEAYEVRPGILMMPHYATDGNLCEIDLERFHFLPGIVDLDFGLTDKEIDTIADELVPRSERGQRQSSLDSTVLNGEVAIDHEEFEKISIITHTLIDFGSSDSPGKPGEKIDATKVVAIIRWKEHPCQ